MKIIYIVITLLILISLTIFLIFFLKTNSNDLEFMNSSAEKINLEKPRLDSQVSIEAALAKRRSVRNYQARALSLADISQILWSAQGISDQERGFRTSPSAGALYPLEIYMVINQASQELGQGVYKYQVAEHQLFKVKAGELKNDLSSAALGQAMLKEAPAVLVMVAIYERITDHYGQRGDRYVHMEAGHAAQNVYLQAVSLNLGTVVVGAFDDQAIKEILDLPEKEVPLYLMPIGYLD